MLRSGYRVEMRTIDGAAPATVAWFRVPKDRPWVRGWTPFRSRNWRADSRNDGIGEQREGRDRCGVEYMDWNGRAPAPYDGAGDACGTPAAWANGLPEGHKDIFRTNVLGQPPCCAIGHADAPARIAAAQADGERRKGEAAPAIIALNPFAELEGIHVEAAPVRIGDKPLSPQAGEDASGAAVRLGQWMVTFERDEVGIDAGVDLGADHVVDEGPTDRELCPVVLGVNPLSLDEEDGAESAPVRIGDKPVSAVAVESIVWADAPVRIGDKPLSSESDTPVSAGVRIALNPPPEDGDDTGLSATVELGIDPATMVNTPVDAYAFAPVRIAVRPHAVPSIPPGGGGA